MVDLHSHILPNIDDGAGSRNEAQKMAAAMLAEGITRVVCTPHFNPVKSSLTDFVSRRSAALADMGLTAPVLIPGSETILHDYLFYYADISPLSIGTTKYMLLELPYDKNWKQEIYDQLIKIMNNYNLIPVIAHIERYEAVKKKEKKISELIELGCLLQVNAGSVINTNTRKRVMSYIKKGYVDVLASDCHNMINRPPNLASAYEIIEKELGSHYCNHLMERADYIISGEGNRKMPNSLLKMQIASPAKAGFQSEA